MEWDAARRRLEDLRAELDSTVATLQGEHAGEDTELSHLDQHPADSATNISDADRQAAVLEAALDQRAQVVAALGRITDGTYGRCVQCGAELPDARLEARPEAARCVSCQARSEENR